MTNTNGSLMTEKPFHAIARSVAIGLCALLTGCMTNDRSTGTYAGLFPKPLGEKIIPLENQPIYYGFRYVEMDDKGAVLMRLQSLSLTITPRGKDLYGYAFEEPDHGPLLQWKDGGDNRDSAGIYIVGNFRDTANFIDSTPPVLWLPQLPKPGVSWRTDSLHRMELVNGDTILETETLFLNDGVKRLIAFGFQRHSTVLFRETAGDTVTYYHFGRGVGLMAFERSVLGRLLASGTLVSFSPRDPSSP
jgi:hypothetical protein